MQNTQRNGTNRIPNKQFNSVASLPGTALFTPTRRNGGPLTGRYTLREILFPTNEKIDNEKKSKLSCLDNFNANVIDK